MGVDSPVVPAPSPGGRKTPSPHPMVWCVDGVVIGFACTSISAPSASLGAAGAIAEIAGAAGGSSIRSYNSARGRIVRQSSA